MLTIQKRVIIFEEATTQHYILQNQPRSSIRDMTDLSYNKQKFKTLSS